MAPSSDPAEERANTARTRHSTRAGAEGSNDALVDQLRNTLEQQGAELADVKLQLKQLMDTGQSVLIDSVDSGLWSSC